MPQPYSQSKALWAITKASFKAIFAQPISIVFSLLFPIIFILIFGAFGNNGISTQKIAIRPGSDTSNAVFDSLKANRFVRLVRYTDTAVMRDELEKGKLTGILFIQPTQDTIGKSKYL
ncbi:MAG TPA: ABC transporter permease, partial [Chitinophagaceae bacterium]|nr:ABC transporter permease [Chitinophagaceae bacterium]